MSEWIKVKRVHSPRWADHTRSAINCTVKFNHLKAEHEFTAARHDPEPHGRDIFERCLQGEFGPIADPPSGETLRTTEVLDLPNPSVSGWPEAEEFLREANLEIARGTVRGIVLVTGSMLEHALKRFLSEHGETLPEQARRDFPRSVDDFKTLDRSIVLLERNGLCSPEVLRDLQDLKAVRNAVSHHWHVSLSNQRFAAEVCDPLTRIFKTHLERDFKYVEHIDFLAKLVFAPTCITYVMHFSGWATTLDRSTYWIGARPAAVSDGGDPPGL